MVLTPGGGCVLVISPVLVEDDGLYQCQLGAVPGTPAVASDTALVTVVSPPTMPYIVQAVNNDVVEVVEGEEVLLNCSTQGSKPPAELIWKDDNGKVFVSNILETVEKVKSSQTYKTTSILKTRLKMSLNLTCSAFSEQFPNPTTSRKLEVRLKFKPRPSLNITNDDVKEGDTVVIHCPAKAFPSKVAYSWYINGEEQADKSNTLTIRMISRVLDKAVVTCKTRNIVGKSEQSEVLDVKFVPSMVQHPVAVVATKGEEVNMRCKAEGNPEPRYVWIKQSSKEIVAVSENLTVSASDATEGDYICKVFVEGKIVLTSRNTTLKLMRRPIVSTESIRYSKLGSDVIFQCKVHSLSNKTKVTWTKNDEPIDYEHVKHKVVHTDDLYFFSSDLIIYNVAKEDFAVYGCFSSNEIGTDYRTFPFDEDVSVNYLSIIITINTVLGILIFVCLLVYQKKRRTTMQKKRDHQSPIYRGSSEVFDEMILEKEMTEEYIDMELFDNLSKRK